MTPLATLLAEALKFDRLKEGAKASHEFMQWCAIPESAEVRDWEWFVNGADWRNARTKPITDQLLKVVEAVEEYDERIASCDCGPSFILEALASLRKLVGEGVK